MNRSDTAEHICKFGKGKGMGEKMSLIVITLRWFSSLSSGGLELGCHWFSVGMMFQQCKCYLRVTY